MSTCKKCGNPTSFMSTICNDCKKEQKELDRIEKQKQADEIQRKEEEKKRLILEEAHRIVNQIVQAATNDAPLKFLFINKSIVEKKQNSGMLGAVVGGALGGVAGAMIGGALTSSEATYSGTLGMLVVTRNQIIIKHFESGFLSAKGDISMDHLKLFLSKLRTEGKINSLIFNISQTQISASDKTEISQCSVICGSEAYTFNKSQLYINDKIVEMAAAEEVAALSKENGALIAPGEFVEKLLGKENPISLAQFNEIEQDDTYFCNVFSEIVRHNQRNEIVSNFHILCSPLRKILETKITEQANRYTRIMTWLVSSSFFAIIAGYGIVYLYDFNAFLAGAVSCISLIVSVNSFLNLKKTIWCRDTCHGNLMMVERA